MIVSALGVRQAYEVRGPLPSLGGRAPFFDVWRECKALITIAFRLDKTRCYVFLNRSCRG